jgi:hypothetical protein
VKYNPLYGNYKHFFFSPSCFRAFERFVKWIGFLSLQGEGSVPLSFVFALALRIKDPTSKALHLLGADLTPLLLSACPQNGRLEPDSA